MTSLVGYTGFVGSNLYAAGNFDKAYNSKNLNDAYGTKPDLLVYAGLRAEKYLANNDPEADWRQILQAEENISKIEPKKLVLISTIDVLKEPAGKDESSAVETEGLQAYGLNRFRLEEWVRKQYPDALILRLPGLYGRNLKKNFIFDYIHVIPSTLKGDLFTRLSDKAPEIKKYYELQPNGFYKYLGAPTKEEEENLKSRFEKIGFTALNFTDSRSVYQFYPLSRLWSDMQVALSHDLRLLHLATEPISAAELYKYLAGSPFVNEISDKPAFYDYRTLYSGLFGGSDCYLLNKQRVLGDIKRFAESEGTKK